MSMTFKEQFEAARARYCKPVLYNRKEAYRLLGFGKSVSLTNWLKENNFMGYNDYPESYCIERALMDVNVEYITRSLQCDDYGIPLGGSEYDCVTRTIKTIYTPLFTKKGIEYFKRLLADPAELQKVVEEIKSQYQYYYTPIL